MKQASRRIIGFFTRKKIRLKPRKYKCALVKFFLKFLAQLFDIQKSLQKKIFNDFFLFF